MTDQAGGAAEGLPEEALSLFETALDNFYTLKDIRGLTTEQMEGIYALAYNLYDQSLYEEAHNIFTFLCLYDHLETKYWLALGACRQMLKRYQAAIDAFSMAALLDEENPAVPLHAAECYLALDNLDGAEQGAEAARWLAEKHSGHDAVSDRAGVILNYLQDKKASAAAGGQG